MGLTLAALFTGKALNMTYMYAYTNLFLGVGGQRRDNPTNDTEWKVFADYGIDWRIELASPQAQTNETLLEESPKGRNDHDLKGLKKKLEGSNQRTVDTTLVQRNPDETKRHRTQLKEYVLASRPPNSPKLKRNDFRIRNDTNIVDLLMNPSFDPILQRMPSIAPPKLERKKRRDRGEPRSLPPSPLKKQPRFDSDSNSDSGSNSDSD
jgi:hypothetical protein